MCCNKPTKVKQYPQAAPDGETVVLLFNGGRGPHSLRGPVTGTKYRVGSDGILRPAVFAEDAEIILTTYGGKFEEA